MAALYWRVKGQGKRAIDCLRQALNYAPHRMKASVSAVRRYSATLQHISWAFSFLQDVPLISLANIFQNARLWEDALTVARMAVEIAPHFVVNHFTLANVYVTMVIFIFTQAFVLILLFMAAHRACDTPDCACFWSIGGVWKGDALVRINPEAAARVCTC